MTAKRLRMTLDFEVEVEELTDERLHEYYRRFGNYEELVGDAETWENISRQRRLLRALLEDEEALGRFLTYVVVDKVDSRIDSRLGETFRGRRRRSWGRSSRGWARRTRATSARWPTPARYGRTSKR